MGRLKDDNNIQIYGWMTTKLKLKGNELLIYAVIYSFSRNDNGNLALLIFVNGLTQVDKVSLIV